MYSFLMESDRAHQRKIIHVDMDCFYAAIEMRDRPELMERPVAVGASPGQRGVLCTSNYVARRYGVRSAMPTARALQLCPRLVVLPVDMRKYRAVSRAIHAIFAEFSDWVEPLSLDEAYLDVSESRHCSGSATLIAQEIRHRIFQEHALTASAGIAPNKFLAKVASDWKKPNGQWVVAPPEVEDFVKALPVDKMYGVGKVTAQKLHRLQIKTCGDMQQLPLGLMLQHFGRFGERLYHLCRGLDDRPVEVDRVRKSVSVEHTFPADLPDFSACVEGLPRLVAELKERLLRYSDRVIHKQFVKVKFSDFQQTTVESRVSAFDEDVYLPLLREGYQRREKPVRLFGLGVGFQEVDSGPFQGELGL